MSTTTKPTMVFVPGSWLSPEIYEQTMASLTKDGYPTVGCPLASVGADPAHTNFDGDVKGIRECLSRLIEDEQKEVIIVCHSYSGIPSSEASAGLAKSLREPKGLKGGLIRIVYIMAYAVPEGYTIATPGAQLPPWMKADMAKGIVIVTAEDARDVFYNDMTHEESDRWSEKHRHESMGVYGSTTTYAAWRDVPSTFVIATEDKTMAFTREVVDGMIKTAREQVPSAFDVVEIAEGAGHCPMVSRPEWVADVLRRAAEQKV
jgi:pimeloyl-ACP methyl ester carboxylesterase